MSVRVHLDEYSPRRLAGWAFDGEEPNAHIALEIWLDGRFQTVVFARDFREDLRDVGLGDGGHAFEYRFSRRIAKRLLRDLELRTFPAGQRVASRPGRHGRAPFAACLRILRKMRYGVR